LKLKLASAIDCGEIFVIATYNLEGDGPLAFICYEEVKMVIAAVRVAHTPNTEVVICSTSVHTAEAACLC